MRGGRRIALLLAGVLPLLAEDDAPVVIHEAPIEQDENDVLPLRNAAEALHDDTLDAIPSIPVEILEYGSFQASGNVVVFDRLVDGGVGDSADSLTKNTSSRETNSSLDDAHQEIPSLRPLEDDETPQTPQSSEDDGEFEDNGVGHGVEDSEGAPAELDDSDTSVDDQPTDTSTVQETAEEQQHVDGKDSGDVDDATPNEEAEGEKEKDPKDEALAPTTVEGVDDTEDEDGPSERLVVDYASNTAGALILEKSPSMKGTSNLLTGNKDKYAIAPCEEKKFVVIGLSEDILVKQVCLANYERYSSRVKDFQILGSQTMGKWVNLGTYTASAGNGEQSFDLTQPSWSRYLKFRFLSHYGSEHYCTVSQIKVHGSTQMQGFHEEWDDSKPDEMASDDAEVAAVTSQTDPQQNESASKKEADLQSDLKEAAANQDEAVDNADTASSSMSEDSSEPEVVEETEASANEGEGGVSTGTMNEKGDAAEQLKGDGQEASEETSSSASVNAASEVAANEEETVTEIDPAAIPPDAEGNDTDDAKKPEESDVFHSFKMLKEAPRVSDVVREIQQKLIGLTPATEREHVDASGEDDDNTGNAELPADASEVEHTEVQNASVEANEEQHELNESRPAEAEIVQQVTEEVKPDAPASHGQDGRNRKAESTEESGSEPEALLDLSRFPSAECLEVLDFHRFKAKQLASKTASGAAGQPDRMEPIFKKLKDEITALQLSQNVQDQFSQELVLCYQKVLREVVKELHDQELSHEARLLRLEAQMELVSSTSMFLIVVRGSMAFWEGLLAFIGMARSTVNEAAHYVSKRGDHLVTILSDETLHEMVHDALVGLLNAKVQLSVVELMGLVLCAMVFQSVIHLLARQPSANAKEANVKEKESEENGDRPACDDSHESTGDGIEAAKGAASKRNHKPRPKKVATE